MTQKLTIDQALELGYSGKFRVTIDGRPCIAFFINALPRVVIKIDGQRRYLWFKDRLIDPNITLLDQAKE